MTDETVTLPPQQEPRPRTRVPVVALVAAVVVALVAGVVLWRVVGNDADAAAVPDRAPYDDARAAGRITLCSDDGQAVTSGSVDDTPFADLAVGATGLPADLDPTGGVVSLFGYQPREGIGPEEFTGIPLTGTDPLVDPERPVVRITDAVYSVADFVAGYPATFDGFVQLRLYLGTPAVGTLTDRPYDAVDLHVDGDRWQLVDGGSADCAAVASSTS